MKNKKDNRFFFNHKGIKGHASLIGNPDKKFMEAFWKMVELSHKIPSKPKRSDV